MLPLGTISKWREQGYYNGYISFLESALSREWDDANAIRRVVETYRAFLETYHPSYRSPGGDLAIELPSLSGTEGAFVEDLKGVAAVITAEGQKLQPIEP